MPMPAWRWLAAALGLCAYVLLSWWAMARWPEHPWTVAALFGPLILGLAAQGLARRHWPSLGGALLLLALVVVAARAGGVDLQRLYLLQHAAMHALLGAGFAYTLRPGATPLITALAQRLHTRMAPGQTDYTRRLTQLWTAYFFGMIALSLLLYAATPWAWWSFFCLVLTPASAVALFVGEYLLRYRLHPEFERISLSQAWQAYRDRSAQSAAAAPSGRPPRG